MKKRIQKHIEAQDFVNIYIDDHDDVNITNYKGIIVDQSEKFILTCDLFDFTYDGLVVLRKEDISEIKHSDDERFFKHILDKEKITETIIEKREASGFKLGSLTEMLDYIKAQKLPLIVECKYDDDEKFVIGPVKEVTDKKVRIDYFNAKGEYDLKPISIKFKDITILRIDSPYAERFYKYARHVE